MGNKLFVGGLPWATDDAGLKRAFEPFGNVTEAKVIYDRDTGKSRGFGFVTFYTEEQAQAALQGMDGAEIEGRRVSVKEAEERKPDRPKTIRRTRRGPGKSPPPPKRSNRAYRRRDQGPPSWEDDEEGGDDDQPPGPPEEAGWAEDKPRRKRDRNSGRRKKKGKKSSHRRFDDDDYW